MSPETAPTPDFVVIGAQKSGTTTLWEDLRSHPDVAVSDKESNGLLDPAVLSPAGRQKYESLFGSARGRTRGEVCTTYAMLPDNPDVVDRARALNPDLRVIYIVREPLARVVSHHHHDFGLGLCGPDIDHEVRHHRPLVDNTRYGSQLAPWVSAFGHERILVIRFEDYMTDRETGFDQVQNFLGLRTVTLRSSEVHNASDGKLIAAGTWGRISEHDAYRRFIRPLLPEKLRKRLMSAVLPAGPERPAPPSRETLQHLVTTLRPEVERLAELTDSSPLWDLDERLEKRMQNQ